MLEGRKKFIETEAGLGGEISENDSPKV